jgi:hypothetical protein
MPKLFLTYDNLAKQDGIGAQLQRIFGIYSLSRKFRIKYIHSPIIGTLEELAHNVTSEASMKNLLDEVNARYYFPSSELPRDIEIETIHNLSTRMLFKFIFKSGFGKNNILLKVCLPFGIMDKHPDWYKYSGAKIRSYEPTENAAKKYKMVVHVRYGYKPIVGSNSGSSPRFLPLTYYPDAVREILKQEKLPLNSEILVHTDIPRENGKWKPFQESKIFELSSIGYEIKESSLEFEGIDLKNEFFSDFPNLSVKHCAPLLETLNDMITADVLLMSRSSFSYIAGIVSQNSVYIPRSHGHGKMSRWKWDFKKSNSPKIELLSGI